MNGRHGGNSLDSDAAHSAAESGRQLSGCLSVVNGRMDIQVFQTALKEYMSSQKRNVHQLTVVYAKLLGVEWKIREYTEVML